jgi:hypothetical protein
LRRQLREAAADGTSELPITSHDLCRSVRAGTAWLNARCRAMERPDILPTPRPDRPMSALPLPARTVDATQALNLSWGVKLQGLTWPFVELTSHFVQIDLRVQ